MNKLEYKNTNISKEMRLIVLFVLYHFQKREKKDIVEFCSNNKIKWNLFINLLVSHKLIPYFLPILRTTNFNNTFPKVFNQIFNLRKKMLKHKNKLIIENVRILNQLKKDNIDVVVYKGFAFTKQFYDNMVHRDSVDIDLAIREEDLPRAAKVILSSGYVEHKNKTDFNKHRQSRAYDIDYSFVYKEEGKIKFNVELHWQPSHNVLWVPLEFAHIIHSKTKIKIGNTELETFDRVHQVIIMCIHHGIIDGWGKLRHIIDLYHVLENLSTQEQKLLRLKLIEYRLIKCFQVGVHLIDVIFDYKNAIFTVVKTRKLSLIIAQMLLENKLNKNWSDQPIKLYYHLKMRMGIKDKARVLYRISKYFLKYKLLQRN